MAELNAIEHVQAIHLLLLHANARLWRGKDAVKAIKDFVASFTQRASCIGDNASILGSQFKKTEMRAWVKVSFNITTCNGVSEDLFNGQEITDMTNRWQVPRRASQNDAKVYQAGDKVLSFGLHIGQRR